MAQGGLMMQETKFHEIDEILNRILQSSETNPKVIKKHGEPNESANSKETDMIRKEGDHWRIISNKTGKFWPQKYKTAESAHAALSAYHAG